MQYFCGRLRKISQQILVKHINCHVQRENSVTSCIFEFYKVVLQHIADEVEIFVCVRKELYYKSPGERIWKSLHIKCQSYCQT